LKQQLKVAIKLPRFIKIMLTVDDLGFTVPVIFYQYPRFLRRILLFGFYAS